MINHSTKRAAGLLSPRQRQTPEIAEDKYAAVEDEDQTDFPRSSQIDGEAEDEGLVSGKPTRPRNERRVHGFLTSYLGIIVSALFCLLSGAMITAVLQNFLSKNTIQRGVLVKPCGSTAAEARAEGCHFDIVSFMWLPDQCWDPELVADFEATNHLEWFSAPDRTGPLTREQVITGEYDPVWVSWEYHWRHCTAMWKKMHRALLGPLGTSAIDGYVAPYHHTLHCEEMFLVNRTKSFEDTDTEVRVKYPDCGMP